MTEALTRTSTGLVDALFDAIDSLNAKKIDPEHARAVAHTARTIVGIASLELDIRKFQKEQNNEDTEAIKSLTIGAIEEAPAV